MSASLAIQDTRLKTLLVLLPAWVLLIFVASQLASEEYFAAIGLLGLFVSTVMFTAFVKTVRFEAAIIGMLLVGYLIGNRGFAQLSLIRPVFIGETGLAAIMAAMVLRFLLLRESPSFKRLLPRLILVFLCMGSLHFIFNVRTYQIDAVRDFALVYYAFFFFAAEQVGQREDARRFLERCLTFGFIGLTVIALLTRINPSIIEYEVGGVPIFFQKDDLTATFAAAGAFFFYLRPNIFRWRWLRPLMIVTLLVFVLNGITRAAIVGLVLGSIPCWVAGQRKFFLYPVVAVIAGVTVLASYSVTLDDDKRTSGIEAMQDKLISMVDFTGEMSYSSHFGEQKAMNNEFRRVFWQSVIDETNLQDPVFGLGFGYDFNPRFERIFQRGAWDGLRSPHNYYVTIYGRMGIVGELLLLFITGTIIKGALRTARLVREGRVEARELSYWCGAWSILVSACLGVVLEGPMGAILFWSWLGLAISAPENPASEDLELLPTQGGRLRMAGQKRMLPPGLAEQH